MKNKTSKWLGLLVAGCLGSTALAQYGERDYPYVGGAFSALTSAKDLASGGFIQAGAMPFASGANQMDFRVMKTDANGLFTGGTFQKQYQITGTSSACSPPVTGTQHGCIGVDIVPTSAGNVAYAVAGAYTGGVFFVTLDAGGVVLSQRHWLGSNAEKPAICVSQTNPGMFYVCGRLNGQAYVVKIDALANIVWSKFYPNYLPRARAIIHSPYNGGSELVVVGRCDVNNFPPILPLAAEAFLMRVNENNGTVISFTGYSDDTNGDEWFNSIKVANSPTGGQGFIIGGRMFSYDPNYSGYVPWMLKVDPNGNPIWSTVIAHNSEITDVVERLNAFYSPATFDYFGISRTPVTNGNQMTVWKLNDVGVPSASPNRFIYGLGLNGLSNDFSKPQINAIGNGTGFGDGLVAWGTDNNSNWHVMMKACYNGMSGCQTTSDMSYLPGPGISYILQQTDIAFVQPCLQRYVQDYTDLQTPAAPCGWVASPPLCSNLRPESATAIEMQTLGEDIGLYPNPTNGPILIRIPSGYPGSVHVSVTNPLGQEVYTSTRASAADKSIELNFADMHLTEGLYFVNLTLGDKTYVKKVTYNN